MYYHEHLRNIGFDRMIFDKYIEYNKGNNHLDNYWVKFDGFGAQRFADLI